MSTATWSYILAGINIFALYLMWQVGNKRRWPWLLYVGQNLLWIAYAFDVGAYGFLASATAGIVVALRNYLKWTREARSQRPAVAGPGV